MTILQHGIAQAAGGGGYQIARSLRFNSADSAYLNRTLTTPTSNTSWAFSCWVKRAKLGSGVTSFLLTQGGLAGFGFDADSLKLWNNAGSGLATSTAVFRDPSAFCHVFFRSNGTNIKGYINNTEYLSYTGTVTNLNSAAAHYIGNNSSTTTFDGLIGDIYFIDGGGALTPGDFAQSDANTGVWNPKTYSGTYGTNGFWLKLDDNSNTTAATLGKDSSGNSNNWTPNNFSVTAGVGNDSLVDSPTNYGTDTGAGGEVRGNYCTLNPLDKGSDVNTVVNGNLDATWTNANGHSIRSTLAVSSGKWYWEFTNVNNLSCGIIKSELKIVPASGSLWPGSDGFGAGGSFAYRPDNGNKTTNSTGTSYGATFTTTDVIGCALDMDNGKIYWSKNGTWQASGDPAAGTNAAYTGISGTFSPAWGYIGAGNQTLTANFGQRAFAYTAPSGFKALCTQNLPTPAIGATSSTLASKNFDAVLYTGTGSSLSITSLAFQPDFTWIKGRSGATNHALYDAVRGVQKDLVSNSTSAETTETTGLTAFGSTGFTIGTLAKLNTNSATYAAWNWKGGNGTVSNTSGTITSTVSANPTAGISVVSYTGTGANATVGHGLGVAPRMIIGKRRNAVQDWGVYHASIGNTGALALNLTIATDTSAAYFNNTSPTSSVFSVGTGSAFNASTSTYIAYAFAEVAGFSKFGTFTSNASADGSFVYCGFRPRFVLIKPTSIAADWILYDTARNTYNVTDTFLRPNLSNADSTSAGLVIDILSNGFKIRGSWNGFDSAPIFAAFAEAPFQYSRAR